MFLIMINFGDRGVAAASCHRIKGGVARADDTVVQNCEEVLVNTKFPSEFVHSFYADGFEEKLEIHPCVE